MNPTDDGDRDRVTRCVACLEPAPAHYRVLRVSAPWESFPDGAVPLSGHDDYLSGYLPLCARCLRVCPACGLPVVGDGVDEYLASHGLELNGIDDDRNVNVRWFPVEPCEVEAHGRPGLVKEPARVDRRPVTGTEVGPPPVPRNVVAGAYVREGVRDVRVGDTVTVARFAEEGRIQSIVGDRRGRVTVTVVFDDGSWTAALAHDVTPVAQPERDEGTDADAVAIVHRAISFGFGAQDLRSLLTKALVAGMEALRRADGTLRVDDIVALFDDLRLAGGEERAETCAQARTAHDLEGAVRAAFTGPAGDGWVRALLGEPELVAIDVSDPGTGPWFEAVVEAHGVDAFVREHAASFATDAGIDAARALTRLAAVLDDWDFESDAERRALWELWKRVRPSPSPSLTDGPASTAPVATARAQSEWWAQTRQAGWRALPSATVDHLVIWNVNLGGGGEAFSSRNDYWGDMVFEAGAVPAERAWVWWADGEEPPAEWTDVRFVDGILNRRAWMARGVPTYSGVVLVAPDGTPAALAALADAADHTVRRRGGAWCPAVLGVGGRAQPAVSIHADASVVRRILRATGVDDVVVVDLFGDEAMHRSGDPEILVRGRADGTGRSARPGWMSLALVPAPGVIARLAERHR